jgi:hypothetical protein
VDARRLHPLDDTDQQAARQVRVLLERLPAGGPLPWFVFDGGYDSAQLTLDLAEVPAAVLVRLRADRCFYADPPAPAPGKTGRPRRHGAKFAFADPATWPAPTATLHTVDDQYGAVTVDAWSGLHPKQQRHPGHGTRGPRPIVRGTVIRVQVERVPAKTRPPKVLWLWWAGPTGCRLDLDLAWRAYIRRFDLEHTVRFAKQTLGWTTPRPRHPEQADRWTWLVLAGYARCAWPASSSATNGCRGSGLDPRRGCHHCGSAAAFRSCWSGSARQRRRRNPQDARRAGPGPLLGSRQALPGDQEARQEAQEEVSHGREGRLTVQPPPSPFDLGRRADSTRRRVKSQA